MDPLSQQLLFTLGGSKTTYIDDLFSTYLYEGNATARSINNGIDLAGEGGLVWTKSRSHARNHSLHDSARGVTCLLKSNSNTSQYCDATQISSFNSNGFSIGTDGSSNTNGDDYTSWTFRKAPGFFDVVTYTGSGNVQSISHSLGSVPGMIIIKRTDASADWYVWHGYDSGKYLKLNSTTSAATNSGNQYFGTTFNSTHFSVGHDSNVNGSGGSYVAYVFAGGASTAATARSVAFSGSSGQLEVASTSDFAFGTGPFTIEFWLYFESVTDYCAIFEGRPHNGNGAYQTFGFEDSNIVV